MLMLCQILLSAKHAVAALFMVDMRLAQLLSLAQLLFFAIQNLASFSLENAQISSLNSMEML